MDDKIELAVVCWQMFNSGLSGGEGIYICLCVYVYPHILLVCRIYGTQFTNDILFIVNSIVLVDYYSMN